VDELKKVLTPQQGMSGDLAKLGVTGLLLLSALCVAIAPAFMPPGYSWLHHAISESASQSLENAWVTRLGFVSFGLSVMLLSMSARHVWARGVVWAHMAFGTFILFAAAFSHKPWIAGVPSFGLEDALHSAAASAMGFAFVAGVLTRLLQRKADGQRQKFIDAVAIAAATLLPIGMIVFPPLAGLLQRLMFATAYTWYAHETVTIIPSKRTH
jgi:hypothetical protein